jgi:hypothetical protein
MQKNRSNYFPALEILLQKPIAPRYSYTARLAGATQAIGTPCIPAGLRKGAISALMGTSPIWNLDFRIAAGLCSTHSRQDPINVALYHRPSRIAQDHNRHDTIREILLITDVLVGC